MRIAILVAAVALSCTAALAFDRGQWGHVSADIRDWVKGLKNAHGTPCCDSADGFDATWDMHDESYRVNIDGNWITLAEHQVLHVPNRLGVARVWYMKSGSGAVTVFCFLPGPQI
jgi:hypothetical protein